MRRLTITVMVLIGIFVALWAASAQAASQTWDGGSADGNWNSVTNWVVDTAYPGGIGTTTNADVATFNAAIANTWGDAVGNPIVTPANLNIGGITFTTLAGNYFIGATDGNPLLLSSGGTIQITNGLTNLINNVVTETINAPLVIQGASGTYTFTNNSANGTAAKAGILNFGGGISGGIAGATVLTLNGSNTNANTISGIIDNGTATTLAVTKGGTGTWILAAANTYTGATTVGAGILQLSGANGALALSASPLALNGGSFVIDNTSVSGGNNDARLGNTQAIKLNGGAFVYKGSDSGVSAETVGAMTTGTGFSTVTVTANGGYTATLTGNLTHAAGAPTNLVNGVGLGSDTSYVGQFKLTTTPTLVGTTAGTTAISTSKDVQIVPFLVGESAAGSSGLGTASGTANTFVTYVADSGVRPLNPTDEFTNNAITAGNNTRITTATVSTSDAAINSLVISGNNLTINDGTTLTDTSGALLFTSSSTIQPSGSTGALAFGTAEAQVTVNSGITGTITAAVTGSAGLTKSGLGTLALSGLGPTSLAGAITVTAGTLQLTANTSDNATYANLISGVGPVTKTGTGTVTLSGLSATAANNYSGLTTLSGGTLAITSNASLTGGLTFSAPSALDLNAGSVAFAGAFSHVFNNATASTITIGNGQTLTTNGGVTIGNANTTSTNKLTVSGTGTAAWNINTPTPAGTIFLVQGGTGTGAGTVLDMSGLPNFTANLGSANSARFQVDAASVILAANSTITANTVQIGSTTGIAASFTLSLGTGLNTINANAVCIGQSKAALQIPQDCNCTGATLNFYDSSLGSVKIRSMNGTDRAIMDVFNISSSYGDPGGPCYALFAGHNADLYLSTLTIAGHTTAYSQGGTNNNTGTFSFDRGTLDVTTVDLSNRGTNWDKGSAQYGRTTANNTSYVTLGGGTVKIGTLTMATNTAVGHSIGGANLGTTGDAISTLTITGSGTNDITTMTMGTNAPTATYTVAGSDTNVTANISGGTTTIGTLTMGANNTLTTYAAPGANTATSALNISGTAAVSVTNNLTMGQTVLTNGRDPTLNFATADISITGGSLTVGGNIQYTHGAGTETNTVTLNGGLLDMTAGTIGGAGGIGAGAGIITFNAQSGTLQNLAELNGGTTPLTKTTSGTLILTGTNTYTGGTTITDGTLQLANPTGSALTATSAVQNNSILQVSATGQSVGAISGAGTTQVDANKDLTATSIVQNTLTIGAGGSVTIRETTGAGSASPVPEPGTWILIGTALAGLLALRRRR